MKLIKPSWEIWEQAFPVRKMDMSVDQHRNALIDAMYQHIERCGRVCYKSESKITDESAKPFVDRMIKSKHLAVLEHGTVYLWFLSGPGNISDNNDKEKIVERYHNNPYSKVNIMYGGLGYYQNCITTNYRTIVENGWEDDLQYISEPTEYHEKRHCVHLVTNIHVYKDLTRHRSASFAVESTRYCNYSKNKFDNELTFIIPCWMDLEEGQYKFDKIYDENNWEWTQNGYAIYLPSLEHTFLNNLFQTESDYIDLINAGWKPQQAANILPQATKADVIITSFASHWQHIFNLRTSTIAATGQPHPQVAELMNPLYVEFKNRNYV